jgi:hypothetical protein
MTLCISFTHYPLPFFIDSRLYYYQARFTFGGNDSLYYLYLTVDLRPFTLGLGPLAFFTHYPFPITLYPFKIILPKIKPFYSETRTVK